ncbi:HAMP domain-containing sensor histidine kinase [Microbacterium sp. M3]|uniref:histidine kinase n=1 Tax=Microbacterium arthrosphaerae TaxID=792652 RepID=A0ABU4GVX2_9MICO|nr:MULTISPECIES: HAMP domain-containing sensor histidine kinase [Microbacterium]MDW4571216.1 HAMP domain-containing sensor histidine kinase [Microbacterium arthrosphaerae]MDW7605071.1 HAMP domain-containing sensor histidine kinase [Microbacterium sp. M3]
MARTPRPIPARVRILAAILAVACVGLAIVGSVTFLVQREQALGSVKERLDTQVESLKAVADDSGAAGVRDGASAATEQLDMNEYDSIDDYLYAVVARLVPARNEASLALVDGVPRWKPSTLSGFDISDNQQLIDRVVAETSDGEAKRGTAVTDQGSLRYIAIPVSMPGDDRKGLYVRAVDLGAELQPVTLAMTTYVVAALAVLAAIAVVGWFVTGRLLSPIRHLRETADAISISDLSLRLEPHGNDDISDLSRTVNSMLDRLEDSVDGQRQLLDDVRHELKTPITIVRGHLELMDPRDAVDVASARDIGIAELDRLARLVEDIDLLATAEADAYTLDDVDLGALTARVGELVAVIPGHTWTVEARADGTAVGDQDRLLQAWLQLADNAAKYTPAGSPIEIGSAHDDAGARLWVRDHGPGIPAAARVRIFRRFDRAHVKRAVGGSGLGLAIVDAIAKGHGGHCAVTDTPGGGATFTIHLPPSGTEAGLPAPVRAGDVVLQREASG